MQPRPTEGRAGGAARKALASAERRRSEVLSRAHDLQTTHRHDKPLEYLEGDDRELFGGNARAQLAEAVSGQQEGIGTGCDRSHGRRHARRASRERTE